MNLHETQALVFSAVQTGEVAKLADFNQLTSALNSDPLRLNIYANNHVYSKLKVLRHLFPASVSLVGDDFFKRLAIDYIDTIPSTSYDIAKVGQEFSAFAGQYTPANAVPYLSSLIAFEWTLETVLNGPSNSSMSVELLLAELQKMGGDVILSLPKGAVLHHAVYNVQQIFDACRPDYSGGFENLVQQGDFYYLLFQENCLARIEEITALQAKFLSCLRAALPLVSVFENLMLETGIENFDAVLPNLCQRACLGLSH